MAFFRGEGKDFHRGKTMLRFYLAFLQVPTLLASMSLTLTNHAEYLAGMTLFCTMKYFMCNCVLKCRFFPSGVEWQRTILAVDSPKIYRKTWHPS